MIDIISNDTDLILLIGVFFLTNYQCLGETDTN